MRKLYLFSLLLLFFLLAAAPDGAEACSCLRASTSAQAKGADQVLLVKANKDVATETGFSQTFTIFHTFKGEEKKAKTFNWVRTNLSMCAPAYKDGEIAILYVIKKDLGLCSGNYPGKMLSDLSDVLKANKQDTSPVPLAAMQEVLTHGLKGYLHSRAKIIAHSPSLSGKAIQLGKTTIAFQPKPKATLLIDKAFAFGNVIYVEGRYKTEGVSFRVLLHKHKKGYKLVNSEVFES